MGSLAQAKALGTIGSLLVLLPSIPFFPGALLSIFPYAWTVTGFIGFFLILMAVKNISEFTMDKSIFNNMFIYFILILIEMVAGSLVAGYAIFAPFFIVSMIFYIISVIFLKRSYDAITSKLNIKMFSIVAQLKYMVAVLDGIFIILLLFSFLYSYFTETFLTETTLLGGTVYFVAILAGIIGYLPLILEPIAYFSLITKDSTDKVSQEITIIDTTYHQGR